MHRYHTDDSELVALLEWNGLYIPSRSMNSMTAFRRALTISLKTKLANRPPDTEDADDDELDDGAFTAEVPDGAAVPGGTPYTAAGGEFGLSRGGRGETIEFDRDRRRLANMRLTAEDADRRAPQTVDAFFAALAKR